MNNPENFHSVPTNEGLNQSDDTQDKEMVDSLEKAGEECRREFPTVELAVDAFIKGLIDRAWLEQGYTKEEVDSVLDSGK